MANGKVAPLDADKKAFARDVIARIMFHLENLEKQGTPGSVTVAIHRDSVGVKKVIFDPQEVWSPMTPPNK